ncbi:MAG TPA: DNA translocase FtsK 4TM domain-containing protein [Anaeromyxobacter sp.]|nr:DNA translocase FtsK 4TM domain-containing protein [Anaeromyxobacter sp.]
MAKPKPNRRVAGKDRAPKGRGESAKPRRTGMAREITAIVILALTLAGALALATFHPLDGELVERGLPIQNLVGPVGDRTASFLFRALGVAAPVLALGLAALGWRMLRGVPSRITAVGTAAYAVLIVSVAALAHLALAGAVALPFPAGGAAGAGVARLSARFLSTWGSAIALTAVAAIALVVATGISLWPVLRAIWAGTWGLVAFGSRRLAAAVDEHREAMAELRAEEAERARQAAEELAESAEIEAEDDDSREEARAAAGAMAMEHVRRQLFDDPAWVDGFAPPAAVEAARAAAAQSAHAPQAEEAAPAASKRRRAERAEPAPEPEVEEAPKRPEPVSAKPEIIVSQALLERGKKKGKKKDVPSFDFQKSGSVFRLPTTDLLDAHDEKARDLDEKGLTQAADIIVATLRQHGVEGVIKHIRPGPVVTLYEFSPVAGVKLARIENLDKELTMALSATRIRIIAPIPGKGVVGIEVPNKDRATVWLRDLLESEAFASAGGFLPLGLGKNIEGVPYCVDLQRMPHLLIAGTTGSGKSVGLNTMILSLLFRQSPAEVRMIMVDPKMTELSAYEDIPHLLLPVVTDPQKAARALQWAVDEMERRTQILADTGSKDLRSYNGKVEKLRAEGRTFDDPELAPPKKLVVIDVTSGETEDEAEARARAEAAAEADGTGAEGRPAEPKRFELYPEDAAKRAEFEDPTAPPPADPVAARDEPSLPKKLPYIVVVIDELADLMMTAPREVEISLARLAQKARATGIHLIVATQRPSTDVVTGMIKNNFPARISFRLASRHDSQTIINGPGAEALLGDGDMLILTATQPITRVQGAFVSEEELHRVVAFLKEQGRPVYDESILKAREGAGERGGDDEEDPVYDQAVELVSRMEEVSVSKLQREMRLGYNKAAKIVERMEREGIVGPANGVKPRQVLIRPIGEVSATPNV